MSVARLAPVLALALLAGAFAGCIGAYHTYTKFDPDVEYKNPGVFPGNYTFGNDGSKVLMAGPYRMGAPEIVHLRSTLPAYASPVGDQTSDGTVLITMAVWRPQNATEPVPVIVDAGPYYENGQHCKVKGQRPCMAGMVNDTIDYAGQSTPFSLKNFLPYGYAVAQLAVRGTGTSGGCMDLMGPAEVHDLVQAIDWLGEQPWSNGNVAMIGTSYDGSTPWEVASTGDPHLKTIVPQSGLPDMFDLMIRNGSAETRAPIMHDVVYWNFGFSDDFGHPKSPVPLPVKPPVDPTSGLPGVGTANGREQYQDMQNLLCPKVYEGATMGAYSWINGDRGSTVSQYWTERDHRPGVLQNYKGSVFLVHGLQDWNVDPHSAIPFNTQLHAAGLPMKEWYGQWDHNTPDGQCQAKSDDWATHPCRLDYAEVLLRWFNHYLKGQDGVDLGPAVQVEDNLGYWRNLDSFPPAAEWSDLHLTGDGLLRADAGTPAEVTLSPGTPATPGSVLELKGDVLSEDLRFSGIPELRVPFQPQGPGGQLAVWLFDQDGNGSVRAMMPDCDARGHCQPGYGGDPQVPIIGHGQLNLRYHAGGDTPQPLVPGQTYTATVQFEPLDVMVPKGHRLVAWVFQGQFPDHLATMTPSPVKLLLGDDAVLRLPVIHVDPTVIFPVPGVHFPARHLYERMDTQMPAAPPTSAVTTPLGPLAQGPSDPSCAAAPSMAVRLSLGCAP